MGTSLPAASSTQSHRRRRRAGRYRRTLRPSNAWRASCARTKKGRATYARRKAIVEPVFGQLDTVQDARRLLLRGKPAARAQWRFHCAIHNLLKLHRAGGLALVGAT